MTYPPLTFPPAYEIRYEDRGTLLMDAALTIDRAREIAIRLSELHAYAHIWCGGKHVTTYANGQIYMGGYVVWSLSSLELKP